MNRYIAEAKHTAIRSKSIATDVNSILSAIAELADTTTGDTHSQLTCIIALATKAQDKYSTLYSCLDDVITCIDESTIHSVQTVKAEL